MKKFSDLKTSASNDRPKKELAPWELTLRQSRTASKGPVISTTGHYSNNAAVTDIIRTSLRG